MNKLLILLMACVTLAILRMAVVALMVALALVLLFFLVTRPRETLASLGVVTLFGLASAQPTAFIITLGVLGVAVAVVAAVAGARRKLRSQLLLTDAGAKPQSQLLLADRRDQR